jgi:hypothetical protein
MCVFRIFSPGENRGANREVYPAASYIHSIFMNARKHTGIFSQNRLLDTQVYALTTWDYVHKGGGIR